MARGTKLTSQLLAFSRTQRLELHPVELNALIEGMKELIRSSVGSLVACEFSLGRDLCHVCGNATQLELAVLNLAINARDAMPDGGLLSITTRPVTLDGSDVDLPAGDYVELAVTDSGSGMPPEVAARAMDPFFTTKGVGAGTGLGLSMAFGVATQSGGTLRLRSIVGEGTCVTFILPCSAPDDDSPSAVKTKSQASNDDLTGVRIAVVDNDTDVRQFVADCVRQHGARCDAFDGGDSFLAHLETASADIVLLDFAMPGLSGAEVARRAKRIDPQVPVTIMTGYADSAALDEILGDVQVIRKPFGINDLLAAIKSRRNERST